MIDELKRKFEKVCEDFFFENNAPTVRAQIVEKLDTVSDYKFKDTTTNKLVDEGYATFVGVNEKTNKTIQLTIAPTYWDWNDV